MSAYTRPSEGCVRDCLSLIRQLINNCCVELDINNIIGAWIAEFAQILAPDYLPNPMQLLTG